MELPKKKYTQAEVENYIQVAGQSGVRWFKISFLDEDMNNDPVAQALMVSISDVIHDSMMSTIFTERQAQAKDQFKEAYDDTH